MSPGKSFSTPSSNMAPTPVVARWRGTKICWKWTWESATCSLRSSSTPRQTGHLGGLYSRSRYLSSSAAVYSHFKTSVFNARLAFNCRRTAASPATSAAVSVHQGSGLSPTNEFICDPEIRRVDGSVQDILYTSHCRCNTRRFFFAERVINVWNLLPPTVNFSPLALFKRTIR